MAGAHYDRIVDQVADELWTYAETTSSRGARLLKVFFYDEDFAEGRCYVELEEKDNGLMSSNADYHEYLIGSGEELPTDDLDADEAMDLLWAACDDTFPGYFACDDPGYIGWVVDGVDYSTEDAATDWYWRDDIVEIGDRSDLADWEKDDIYYEAARQIVLDNGEFEEGEPEFDEAVSEEASCIINLFSISTSSRLYELLPGWYDYLRRTDPEWGGHYRQPELYADMEQGNIRNCFYHGGDLWFVTGTGYAIMSDDLLGGTSSGEAERAFDRWAATQE